MSSQPRHLFWTVSATHFLIDMFNGSGPVLMAYIGSRIIPMSNTEIGFAVSAYQLTGALTQPFFGMRADRTGGRVIGALSIAWTCGFIMLSLLLVTLTRNYWVMLIPFVLGALGSGAFHPIGTMHASESSNSVSKLSVFFLLGQFGSAVAPTVIGILLDGVSSTNYLFTQNLAPFTGRLQETGSLTPLFVMIILAVPGILMMARVLPTQHQHAENRTISASKTAKTPLPLSRGMIMLLGTVILLRALSTPGAVSFVPRLFQLKGWSPAEYGSITSIFWIASGFSGVFFGWLAERYSTRTIISISMILSAPAMFFLPIVDGYFLPVLLGFVGGGLNGGSHTLFVALAQQMLPARRGFASGAALGFIFGAGAVGTITIGALSDQIGIPNTFQIVAVSAVLTGILALKLPNMQKKARSAPPPISDVLPAEATAK